MHKNSPGTFIYESNTASYSLGSTNMLQSQVLILRFYGYLVNKPHARIPTK